MKTSKNNYHKNYMLILGKLFIIGKEIIQKGFAINGIIKYN